MSHEGCERAGIADQDPPNIAILNTSGPVRGRSMTEDSFLLRGILLDGAEPDTTEPDSAESPHKSKVCRVRYPGLSDLGARSGRHLCVIRMHLLGSDDVFSARRPCGGSFDGA